MLRPSPHRRLPLPVYLCFVAGSCGYAPCATRADVLLLKNGGQIEGKLLRRPPPGATGDAGVYVVQVDEGIEVQIAADRVGRLVERSSDERQYEDLLAHMPDTAEGHAAMARWCHEHRLGHERDFHWQQVLRHDADQPDARRALGYTKIRGQWMRPEDNMASQGYQKERGAWRLPQQLAARAKQEQMELNEKKLRRDIRTWRGWLRGRRNDEGLARIRSIKDPLAAAGLRDLLADEPDVDVRILYADVLAKLDTITAVDALIDTALNDGNLELRLKCIDGLKEVGRMRAVAAFSHMLGSSDNEMINRAAVGLGRLGDQEAVLPLINALVTRHESIVQTSSGNINPSFGGPGDSGGMNGLTIGGGPKKIIQSVNNKGVLEALIALTRQNFQYSVADWKQWYIRTHSLPDDINLRRDT